MRLVIELKKGEDPQVIVNQLFKYTPLQTTSVDHQPRDRRRPAAHAARCAGCSTRYIEHRKEVIRRRTQFLLRKAEERKHIVEGLRIAVDNIDEVIAHHPRERRHATTAQGRACRRRFGLVARARRRRSSTCASARLTGLEREKLEAEFSELVAEIADLQDILDARGARRSTIIRADLDEHREALRRRRAAPRSPTRRSTAASTSRS